jgi:hypothetical protein
MVKGLMRACPRSARKDRNNDNQYSFHPTFSPVQENAPALPPEPSKQSMTAARAAPAPHPALRPPDVASILIPPVSHPPLAGSVMEQPAGTGLVPIRVLIFSEYLCRVGDE